MAEQKFINQMEPWYGEEEKKAIADYLNSGGWIMEFKKTREFEQMIAEFCGAKYCSVVANGTVSLFIALRAIGVGPGDEVVVPDYTMIATPNAVVLAGAKPIFVDVDDSLCLDVDKVSGVINEKTRAIFHVSINGRAGRLEELKELCDRKGLILLEDAAQSLGSFYKGKHLGNFGAIGSFSFSVPKIITTGQGGALITNDEDLYKKICKVKDFGRVSGGCDIHDEFGWNFKFTDLQAVFGIEQMKKLRDRITRKKNICKFYAEKLKGVPEVELIGTDLEEVSPWFIEILVEDPQKLSDFLKEKNIGSRAFYPAIHTQKIYSDVAGEFPKASRFAKRGLWLPSASQLGEEDVKRVCQAIKDYFATNHN
ncbi:MAG: DegT/DnrJ/EryC1/StrS family aminotransferase [Patescibacteria group bacterium]|nr:DegT/DnrJ/EryC1/StrS family aminotransferase [Patescibacteria group bacterium]MDD5491035.1 DegT/DnrJ/EryC1/StrS family aminotransferase [Patescibacteria group bacterium]